MMNDDSYENPTDTVHQLAERNQDWGATHIAWLYSILYSIQVRVNQKNCGLFPLLEISSIPSEL